MKSFLAMLGSGRQLKVEPIDPRAIEVCEPGRTGEYTGLRLGVGR